MEKHEEVRGTISKLQQEGYRLNPKKCEFFKKEFERVAHKVDQQGIRPLKDKFVVCQSQKSTYQITIKS